MRTTTLLGLATLVFFTLGCDPKKDPEPEEQDFSCIKLTDELGQSWGIYGCNTSDDWGNIALNADEQAFLNFSDTVSLDGTFASTITECTAYPCPVKISAPLAVHVLRDPPYLPVKIKIAIVDESLNVVVQFALKTQAGNGFQLYMDPAKFESGKYYRMYYRVSATGAPSLIEGRGNFLVCQTYIDGVNTTIEADCL